MNTRILKFRYFNSEKFVYSDEFSSSSLQSLALFFDSTLKYSDGKIQQFTGFTDKNGREIYEGDYLSFGRIDKELKMEVKFVNGAFTTELLNHIPKNSEVVGNIFQNPVDNH